MRSPLAAAFLVLALLIAGCQTPPNQVPQGEVKVTVPSGNKRTTANATPGNGLTLILPAPAPAGYVWEISAHDTRYLHQLTAVKPIAAASGQWSVTFYVLRRGMTRVRLVLVPPTKEVEKEPSDLEEIVVTIE